MVKLIVLNFRYINCVLDIRVPIGFQFGFGSVFDFRLYKYNRSVIFELCFVFSVLGFFLIDSRLFLGFFIPGLIDKFVSLSIDLNRFQVSVSDFIPLIFRIGEGEAKMIEHIAKDVFNKVMIPSNDFSDFVGIEAHFQRLNNLLCLESEEVRKVGIWGPSGIGKSTIGRVLFSQLSSRFHHHAFVSYKSTKQWDDYSMKLSLDERLLSEISCQKDLKISHLGVVKQMLNHKKVLIIVDDVDDLEVLNTFMDQTRLVGSGSRIIVITQDRKLLKSQEIELIYEVELPSYDLAIQMFCRYAFGKNSPPYGFEELTEEVALHSSNLPLGLSVLGSSLKGMTKEEWVEMLPRLLNSLDGKIKNTLKVCYDRLDVKEQELFLWIACLSDGPNVSFLKDLLGDSAEIGLKILNDKSLIRRESTEFVRMHSLLQKLGKEINRADPINNRRFLTEAERIYVMYLPIML